MSRTEAVAVLADWLHEHRGPPSCMGDAGLWLYVLVAVASPGDVAVSDFSARAAKEVDALWPDAPPVLRDLLWAAGLVPHGPPVPTEDERVTMIAALYEWVGPSMPSSDLDVRAYALQVAMSTLWTEVDDPADGGPQIVAV